MVKDAQNPDDTFVLHTGQRMFMMVEPCQGGVFLNITVQTKKPFFRLAEKDGKLLVHLTEEPVNNRANRELISELSRSFKRPVFLVSGAKSKTKKLKIEITAETAMQIIAGIAGK